MPRRRGPIHLLTALLPALTRGLWSKITFGAAEGVRTLRRHGGGPYLLGRHLAKRLGRRGPDRLLKRTDGLRRRHLLCHPISLLLLLLLPLNPNLSEWRLLLRNHLLLRSLAPAELVKPRVAGIDVSVDDAIADWRSLIDGTASVRAVVLVARNLPVLVAINSVVLVAAIVLVRDVSIARGVVEIDVAMNARIVVDVVDVHVAIYDRAIDGDVCFAVIDVDVVLLNVGTRATLPVIITSPSCVIDAMIAPVGITIQPCTDGKAHAKRNSHAESSAKIGATGVDDSRIVGWHVDVLGTLRPNLNDSALVDDLPLRIADKVALRIGQVAQALNRLHHIGRLVDIGLPDGGGPVELLVHHVEDFGIVGDGLDADVPRLIVNVLLAIGTHPAVRIVDLIDEGCGGQDLREQRLGVQRDGSQEVVELVGRIWHIGRVVTLNLLLLLVLLILLVLP